MRKERKYIAVRIRALLQKEVRSECPFCRNDDVDHFEVHHINENPSDNSMENLLMVCRICHSKITKGDITFAEVQQRKFQLTTQSKQTSQPTRTNNSIFTRKEEIEFEYIRGKLDQNIRVSSTPIEESSLQIPKKRADKGYWDVSISALEILLLCFSENSESIGMYDLWARERHAIVEGIEGVDLRFSVVPLTDVYDPIPSLVKMGLINLKHDWNYCYAYTKKMYRFVLWIEYHHIEPRSLEYDYVKIGM